MKPGGSFRLWTCCGILLFPGLCHGGIGWLRVADSIFGESRDATHENWSDIDGFDVDRAKWNGIGAGSFRITKTLDRASGPLFQASVKRTRFAMVQIDLGSPSGDPRLDSNVYWRIELKNAYVTGVDESLKGDDGVRESIEFSFEEVIYTYFYSTDLKQSDEAGFDYVRGRVTAGGSGSPVGSGDTDSDGMPDAWETQYGFNVNVADGGGDADGDGFTNLEEYQLGTDPRKGTSFFRAVVARHPTNEQQLTVSWTSVVGKVYVVEWSMDPGQPFEPVATHSATGANSQVVVPRQGAIGFYRVRPQ